MRLKHKLQSLGGGSGDMSRGGSLRRLVVYAAALTSAQITDLSRSAGEELKALGLKLYIPSPLPAVSLCEEKKEEDETTCDS